MSEASEKSDAADRESTRGVAIITVAKAYFLLTGFAQPVLLTQVLERSGYGLYGSVLNAISILNNVVVAGSIQAMSKSVVEMGPSALRRGIVLHVLLGVVLAGAVAALATPIGVGLLGDPQVPRLLRVGAIVVGNYCVYAALVGAINGQQRFRAQAGLDMTFATLRTALVIGMAATAWRVWGAVAGFALASGLIVVVALWVFARRRPERVEPSAPQGDFGSFARRYVRFFAPVLLYQLALNLVLQADLLVLKGLLARRPGVSSDQVNELIGIYKGVQNFAFLPYQLLLAVTFVLFPRVSTATREGDRETATRLLRGALRFSMVALGAMLSVLAGLPTNVLRLAYPPSMAAGGPALRALSLGQGAFALSVITTTVVLAAGRTRAATALMLGMLAAVFAGDLVGIALSPADIHSLTGASLGTAGGCVLGMVAVAIYSRRQLGAFVPPGTFLRVGAATAGAAGLGMLIARPGKLLTLVEAGLLVLVYFAILLGSGELSREDRAALKRIAARRRGG